MIRSLELTDFRSYAEAECAFVPGANVILGENGQGKTNIVEAIGYLATLSSHRVAADAPLVRTGCGQAGIRAAVEESGRQVALEVQIVPGKSNRAKVNGAPVPRARDLLGHLNIVLFAPEDLAIVRGDPSERRRFMDELIVQRTPRMAGVRSDLDRVLRQRSSLLKSAGAARRQAEDRVIQTLQVWDEQLARFGGELIAQRCRLIENLSPSVAAQYAQIANGDAITLSYRSALRIEAGQDPGSDAGAWESLLLQAMAERRREELDRGTTLVGPQRDDLLLEIDGLPAKGYASHGESWSAALSLRLAALDVLRADGLDPILILDDVFAELDAARRDRLLAAVVSASQVIITAAVAEDVPAGLGGARIRVQDGRIQADAA